MQAQTWKKVRALACAVGWAVALTALLLVWATERAPAMQAWEGPSPGAPAEPGTGTRFDGVAPTWAFTEPVSTFVPDDQDTYWFVPQYSVVITFPRTAFSWKKGAVFTFTPRSDLLLGPSWVSLPYFFELNGVYVDDGGEVSLTKPIEINVEYQEEDLNGVLEESLEAFWFDEIMRRWLQLYASPKPADNRLVLDTTYLGPFGIGGRRLTLVYLPTVMR